MPGFYMAKFEGSFFLYVLILNPQEWWVELTHHLDNHNLELLGWKQCAVLRWAHTVSQQVSRAAQSCLSRKVPELPILFCTSISQGSSTEIPIEPRCFKASWKWYFPLYLFFWERWSGRDCKSTQIATRMSLLTFLRGFSVAQSTCTWNPLWKLSVFAVCRVHG